MRQSRLFVKKSTLEAEMRSAGLCTAYHTPQYIHPRYPLTRQQYRLLRGQCIRYPLTVLRWGGGARAGGWIGGGRYIKHITLPPAYLSV